MKIMYKMGKREAESIGDMMRMGKLAHLVTMVKIEGKRSRDQQRIKMLNGLAAWLGKKTMELFEDM